jgi:hypothetical protein
VFFVLLSLLEPVVCVMVVLLSNCDLCFGFPTRNGPFGLAPILETAICALLSSLETMNCVMVSLLETVISGWCPYYIEAMISVLVLLQATVRLGPVCLLDTAICVLDSLQETKILLTNN